MQRPPPLPSFALALGLALGSLLPAGSQAAPAAASRDAQILTHVNTVIQWYRQAQQGTEWIGEPGDRVYFDSEHALANQVVQKAFDAAQAEVSALPATAAPGKAVNATTQALLKSQDDAAAHVDQLQQRIAGLDQQLAAAPGTGRALLQAQRDELAAELDLAKTTHESLAKIATFVSTSGDSTGGAGLADQVAELQRSVPEAFAQGDDGKIPDLHSIGGNRGGLIGRTEALYALFKAVRGVMALEAMTNELADPKKGIVAQLRAPLGDSIRSIIQQGQAASSQAASATEDQLGPLRASVQDLAAKLRFLAAAAVPLRQEQILLNQSQQNLGQWRASLQSQQNSIVRGLCVRAFGLALVLATLLGFSELWRRATLRYIHDVRRRRQLLLVRRFTTGFVIVFVIVIFFVSDYSSLATYAGFLTAGVAVALQTVIVSVAAYFLLIGRYGARVGDRLSVSGVTGQVIDIGLVRFYMMELAGTGVDLHPTGRVAVFANSVLFQPTPIYRQMPGTDYTWHEAVVPLANTADFAFITEKLLAVATGVYAKYKPVLEQQHQAIERLIDLKLDVPAPSSQLRFNDKGVELVIRYPVEINNSVGTDDAMASEILAAIRTDEKISGATTGMPRIQAAVKV